MSYPIPPFGHVSTLSHLRKSTRTPSDCYCPIRNYASSPKLVIWRRCYHLATSRPGSVHYQKPECKTWVQSHGASWSCSNWFKLFCFQSGSTSLKSLEICVVAVRIYKQASYLVTKLVLFLWKIQQNHSDQYKIYTFLWCGLLWWTRCSNWYYYRKPLDISNRALSLVSYL